MPTRKPQGVSVPMRPDSDQNRKVTQHFKGILHPTREEDRGTARAECPSCHRVFAEGGTPEWIARYAPYLCLRDTIWWTPNVAASSL